MRYYLTHMPRTKKPPPTEPARVVEILHPLIEQEIAMGRVWGSKKQ
jgi:hypothetical protein